MDRRKWIALFSAVALVAVSALALSLRRARQLTEEKRGVSLDWMADFFGIIDRAIGLPFRRMTVRIARIREGDKVLDLGCGIGTLTQLEKRKAGKAGYVAGIDIGPRLIAKAKKGAAKNRLDIDFRVASIDDLPFADRSFDVATSSFMVHHLPTEVKEAGFREVLRVLKPGGRYVIADLPAARGIMGPFYAAIFHLTAPFIEEDKYTLDLVEGKVPQMLKNAGFAEVEEMGSCRIAGIIPASFILATKAG